MDEHADVPFLAADDFGDITIREPIAPQVDRLTLGLRQLRDQLSQASGQLARFARLSRTRLAANNDSRISG